MRMLKLERCRNSELAVCRGRQLVADHVQMRAEVEASKQTGSRKFYVESNMYYVYILSNWNNQVLYIDVTNNLERRLYEHKNKMIDGFTKRYNIDKLVYFEETTDVRAALEREKQLKKWRREKKNILVNSINPDWNDLSISW